MSIKIKNIKHFIFPTILLFLLLIVGVCLAWDMGQTTDEAFYNGAGYPMVRYNDYRALQEQPPLAMQFGSLPLLFIQPNYPLHNEMHLNNSSEIDISKTGSKFLYKMGNDPHLILFLERIPILIATILLGLTVFLWSQDLFGVKAAFLSLILFILCPNVLAHGTLFTTDMMVTVFFFLSIYRLKRYFARPSVLNAILSGICCGLALLSKASALLLIPIFTILFITYLMTEQKNEQNILKNKQLDYWLVGMACGLFVLSSGSKTIFVGLAPLCLFAFSLIYRRGDTLKQSQWLKGFLLVLWIGLWIPCLIYAVQIGLKYHIILLVMGGCWIAIMLVLSGALSRKNASSAVVFTAKMYALIFFVVAITIILVHTDFWTTLPKLKPFHHYGKSFDISMTHSLSSHKACSDHTLIKCDWRYFIEAMLVKTPIVTLLLSIIGLILLIFSKKRVIQKMLVIIPPLIYLVFASTVNQVNIGVRHVLPVYPFLFLMAGATGWWVEQFKSVSVRRSFFSVFLILIGFLAYRNLSCFPYYISYFNELVGGPDKGVNYLTDSNIIWGQDNRRLVMFVNQKKIPLIKIASSALNPDELNYYQINWQNIAGEDSVRPKPGWYALDLLAYNNEQFNSSSWFCRKKPDYKVGSTFYVFHVQ